MRIIFYGSLGLFDFVWFEMHWPVNDANYILVPGLTPFANKKVSWRIAERVYILFMGCWKSKAILRQFIEMLEVTYANGNTWN